jgi:hypothetical protein
MRALVLALPLLSLASLLLAPPARAGRSLDEPPAIGKAARAAPKAVAEAALQEAALVDTCKDTLTVAGLTGLACRGVVAVAAARKRPLEKPADVDARNALFLDVQHAAANVRAFEPLSPQPGFTRMRFDTHRALTMSLAHLYDDFDAVPAQSAAHARADEIHTSSKPHLCETAAASLELAQGADASVEERGAIQSILTSHRCFLDESRLTAQPKPGQALKDNQDASKVGETVGDAGTLKQYAQARAIDMQRCTDKLLDAAGKPTDNKKLEDCACGVIKRWKFPQRASDTTASLPIVDGHIDINVTVAAAGTTSVCGPIAVH